MLLPSALSCDLPQNSPSWPTRARVSSSPLSPRVDVTSSHPPFSNIYNTCCALQRMLTPLKRPPIPCDSLSTSTSHTHQSTRLRSRKRIGIPADRSREYFMRRRKQTTYATATRSMPKQTKNMRNEDIPNEVREVTVQSKNDTRKDKLLHYNEHQYTPKTPQRIFYAPDILPFGLQNADFLDIHKQDMSSLCQEHQLPSSGNEINTEWSKEEDGLLVQLVLQKLKLTRSDWYDCARSLGRERVSLNERWHNLMVKGEVGLRD